MPDNNNPIKYSDLVSPDNSITDLIKQLGEFSDTYKEKMADVRKEAAKLAEILSKVSGATEEGREKTRKAATEADKLARAEKELAFAQSENAKKLAELNRAKQEATRMNKLIDKLNSSAEGSYDRLSAQYSINKIRINSLTKAERDEAEAKEQLITKTRELYEEMKQLQKDTGKNQLNVGNYPDATNAISGYGDKLKEVLGLNNSFGDSLLQMGRGGEQGKAIFTAMGDGAKALGKTLLTLLTNPVFLAIAGIAAAGAAFKWWYDYNAGLVEATRLTQQFTGKSGDDLKAFRNEVMAVADTFGKDFQETLIATNALSKQFGISADEAVTLIKDGFIAGADANGEFLDTLKEYPAYFKEAGISADQFVAIIAQTTKQGIFSDKGIDAIKEANLRLREMTTATAEALDGIGISSVQVEQDLQSGAKTTFEVMQEVSAKLSELPDSASEVGTAIADIFGGPGEDAGLQYLRTLKDISTDLDEVKDKTGVLGQLQEEQLQSQIELQNALSGLFDATGGTFETLTTRAKTFVNKGLTAIIKGIVSIINYFIDLYNESLAFRVIIQSIITAVKITFDSLGNAFGLLIKTAKATGRVLKGVFTLDWDEIKAGVVDFGKAFGDLVKETVEDAKQNVQEGVENINRKVKPITIPVTTETQEKNKQTQGGTPKGNVQKKNPADAELKKVEEAYKKNLQARRKLEDAELALENDSWEKRRRQTQLQYDRQIEDLRHELQTEKDMTKEGRETTTAMIEALEKQRTQALEKLEKERQLSELATQKEGIELRLAAVKEGSDEELKLRKELIENERQTALLKNETQSEADINAKYDAQAAALADEYINAQLEIFDQQQALAQSEFDLLQTTEEEKTRFRLKAERDRLKKILELNALSSKKLSEAEIQTILNMIARIENELENTGKKQPKDIYEIFGLKLSDEQKQAISQTVSFAIEQLNSLLQSKIEIANKAVEAANTEVEAAQNALDAELQARANGYANNVVMAQKELALAKQNQAKALKEQEKAQRAQEAVQAAQQFSNLVTATALIWSQLGIFALPAIALMFASFAAAKITAMKATKTSEQYGDGTVELLQGGSHQSGNDIDLGTKPDGTHRRAEGGEFFAVINKRNSRRFRRIIPDVINSLNDGTFANKYMSAYDGANGLTINVNEDSQDLRQLTNDVREIKEQNLRRTFVDGRGYTVEVYKNLKRRTRR